MHYWLFKSEPTTFSIDDLNQRPQKTEPWNGVRNYQVRNMLRSEIKVGDVGFFYHSSCALPGIVGTIEIVKAGYPDNTAWNKNSPYFDPKSSPDHPRWYMVDVKLIKKFDQIITLAQLKKIPELQNMFILRKGNRLSITPITHAEWAIINKLV